MSKQTQFDSLNLLGTYVDAITLSEAINYISDYAAPGRPSCYVIKPYVEFIDRAYAKPELQTLLNEAELSIPDGVALVWAAAYLYAGPHGLLRFWKTLFQIVLAPHQLRWPITERAAGINFTWPLLEQAAQRNLRIYLIGKSSQAEIDAVASAIEKRIPHINLVGAAPGHDRDSPYGEVSTGWLEQTARSVKATEADLILVGMGFPLQEKVCAYLAGHTNHGVFIGEGGTFDYESFGGERRKAPEAIQRVGLEWSWRLVLEPKRIKRQLAIPRFIWRIWRER